MLLLLLSGHCRFKAYIGTYTCVVTAPVQELADCQACLSWGLWRCRCSHWLLLLCACRTCALHSSRQSVPAHRRPPRVLYAGGTRAWPAQCVLGTYPICGAPYLPVMCQAIAFALLHLRLSAPLQRHQSVLLCWPTAHSLFCLYRIRHSLPTCMCNHCLCCVCAGAQVHCIQDTCIHGRNVRAVTCEHSAAAAAGRADVPPAHARSQQAWPLVRGRRGQEQSGVLAMRDCIAASAR
jgi:hypothetical protein